MTDDYWKECISIAAEDCGLRLSDEQLECLSDSVQGGFENYGMSHGYDAISIESEEARELKRIKSDLEKQRLWELRTKPCRDCVTTGVVKDGWGRDVTCYSCDGKGRV